MVCSCLPDCGFSLSSLKNKARHNEKPQGIAAIEEPQKRAVTIAAMQKSHSDTVLGDFLPELCPGGRVHGYEFGLHSNADIATHWLCVLGQVI